MPTPLKSFRISDELRDALRREAEKRQTHQSAIIRRALTEYLKVNANSQSRQAA